MTELAAQNPCYPAYQPSDVPWLGDVPAHWEVRRLRTVADMRVSNVDKHSREDEFPVRLCNYVDVYKNDRITQDMPFMKATASWDEIERFRLEPRDVLITKDSETWDDIGVPSLVVESADDLLSGYHLAILRPFRDIIGPYLTRALQSKAVAYQFHVRANGVTRYGLTHAGIQSVQIPLPPLPEQRAIVRYLDYVDDRIRRYVNSKRKLIALLEEEKQAVINRAVTRGLDPNVRLKPSGVEWLGDMPEHWEVVRFKRRVGFQEGPGIMAADFRESGVPLLRISCLHGPVATLDGCNYLDPDIVRARWSHFAVKEGDYLLSASASTGAVSLATSKVAGCVPYTGIIRLWSVSPRTVMPYVRLFLSSRLFLDQVDLEKSGVAISHFGPTHLSRMAIILPPEPEQQAIVEYVDKATAGIDSAIARARRQIKLVEEYRARLIADVVTGKLDVRGVAAGLPNETDDIGGECVDEDGLMRDNIDDGPSEAGRPLEEKSAAKREVTV